MCYLFYRVSDTRAHPVPKLKRNQDGKPNQKFPLLPIFILILILCLMAGKIPFIAYDEGGFPVLAEWRQEKLNKELEDMEFAEQYVLLAKTNGQYPCLNCRDRKVIYLKKGEVWKYGFTTKGQQGRYPKLAGQNLIYVIELSGSIQECLQQERFKIYHYALLPENISRSIPLIRPPGNKQDS